MLGIAALTRRDDAVEAARLLAQSREILDHLGVVFPALPMWP
jgi:hypothetical protein